MLYRGHHHLVDETVPVLAAAAAEGHRVVVVGERAAGRLIRDALGDAVSAAVSFPSPSDVPDHDADAFLDWLRASVPPTGRLVVLHRYRAAPPARPDSALSTELETLPLTLVCACPHDAGAGDLEAFRRGHGLVTRPAPRRVGGSGSEEGPRHGAAIQACFAELAHLHVLRHRIASAAAAAGFDEPEQDRAVLAVHEASVVACRLVEAAAERALDGAPPGGDACELVASTRRSTMVVEIHLPRRVRLPSATSDDDPLRWVRTFSDETSWSGSAQARRLRVVLHAASDREGAPVQPV